MTDARVTQVAVEEWADSNPPIQVTHVAVEQWSTSFTVAGSAVLGQLAVEEWGVYPATTTARKRRHIAVVT